MIRYQDWDRCAAGEKHYMPMPETEWQRPDDPETARQWRLARVREHVYRGRFRCTMRGEPTYECTREAARCCQGGDPVVRLGWRLVTVRRSS